MTDLEATRQQRYELAAEPQEPPCRNCGCPAESHGETSSTQLPWVIETFPGCRDCDTCDDYEPRDAQDDADAAYDAATERWERSRE